MHDSRWMQRVSETGSKSSHKSRNLVHVGRAGVVFLRGVAQRKEKPQRSDKVCEGCWWKAAAIKAARVLVQLHEPHLRGPLVDFLVRAREEGNEDIHKHDVGDELSSMSDSNLHERIENTHTKMKAAGSFQNKARICLFKSNRSADCSGSSIKNQAISDLLTICVPIKKGTRSACESPQSVKTLLSPGGSAWRGSYERRAKQVNC
jgi:hypothetical protein